jgi:hypothetical protein
MHDHSPEDEIPVTELQRLGYDPRDVTIAPLQKGLFGFIIFTTVSIALSVFVYKYLDYLARTGHVQVEPPQLTQETVFREPPAGPLLQSDTTVKTDIHTLLQREDQMLNSYGWVDEAKGIAHVPIGQAMDMVVQKGLGSPTTSTPTGGVRQ